MMSKRHPEKTLVLQVALGLIRIQGDALSCGSKSVGDKRYGRGCVIGIKRKCFKDRGSTST